MTYFLMLLGAWVFGMIVRLLFSWYNHTQNARQDDFEISDYFPAAAISFVFGLVAAYAAYKLHTWTWLATIVLAALGFLSIYWIRQVSKTKTVR